MQSNFLDDILEALGSELPDVEAISILGPLQSAASYTSDGDPRNAGLSDLYAEPLTWAEAIPHLDYPYNPGFGTMDCHDILIWTKDSIFYVHEYDGSTSLRSVPRNPPARKS